MSDGKEITVSGCFGLFNRNAPEQPPKAERTFRANASNVERVEHDQDKVDVMATDGQQDFTLAFGLPEEARLAAEVLNCQLHPPNDRIIRVDTTGSGGAVIRPDEFIRADRYGVELRFELRSSDRRDVTLYFASPVAARLALQLVGWQHASNSKLPFGQK